MHALTLSLLLFFPLLLTGCAQPYIYKPDSDPVRPVLHDGFALMEDGFRLPVTAWKPDSTSQAVILGLHGMNDYRKAFEKLGQYLSARDITLYAYDQRGFGETRGAGYWHGQETMIRDLQTLIKLLRRKYPQQPLYVLGESMGGGLAIAAQSHATLDIDGYILVAPAIWSRDNMPFYQRLLLWAAVHTVPAKKLTGEGLELKPTDNIDMLRAWARDPLVIKATRVDVLYGVTNLMDSAVAATPEFQGKVLALYGKHDEIIPRTPVCKLLESFSANPATRLKTRIYRQGYHMLTRDLNAAAVWKDIATWVLDEDRLQSNNTGFCPDTEKTRLAATK